MAPDGWRQFSREKRLERMELTQLREVEGFDGSSSLPIWDSNQQEKETMGVDVSLCLPDEANWDEKLDEKEMSAEGARAWAEKQAAEWVALAEKRRAEWMAVAEEVEKLTSRGWEVSRVVYDVNDGHFRYYTFWHPDIVSEEDARAAF